MTIGRVDSTPNTVSLLDLDQQLNTGLAGDSGAEIAALLLLAARDSRNAASTARQAEEQRLTTLQDQQVEALYDQADATRAAGWAQGMGLMISGGFAVAGAVASTDGSQTAAQAYAGPGSIAKGGLDLLASGYQFQANVSSAEATDAGNQAKQAERRLQQLGEAQSDAAQLARAAIQAASDLARSQTAGEQATMFLRA